MDLQVSCMGVAYYHLDASDFYSDTETWCLVPALLSLLQFRGQLSFAVIVDETGAARVNRWAEMET
jgi:hypothetical protein